VQSSYGVRYAQVLAAALLGGLPLVALFLAFQRQLVTAIKG
jgi:multiple sugar transport system permease protein